MKPVINGGWCYRYFTHKDRGVAVRFAAKGLGLPTGFESPEDIFCWVGEVIKPVRTKSGVVVWITDKLRHAGKGNTPNWKPADKWIAYCCCLSDPLLVAMFDSQLERLVHDTGASAKHH